MGKSVHNVTLICLAIVFDTFPLSRCLSNSPHLPHKAPLSMPEAIHSLTTASGKPVCSYALGGAARSSQPSSLPYSYYQRLQEMDAINNSNKETVGAPFYFYYNPHRYPAFMSGILNDICDSEEISRKDIFIASGGTDRSISSMDQRLNDALLYSGGEYLDMFVLEYVCPSELESEDIQLAIEHAKKWVKDRKVRYIAASTHSHTVGSILASYEGIDALMLRYNMAHKEAAKSMSLPACLKHKKPVIAFTTTRWNALQDGHKSWNIAVPSTGDCLSFALSDRLQLNVEPNSESNIEEYEWPIKIVLHSSRDEKELDEALTGLRSEVSDEEIQEWSNYGDLNWNNDGFDEYPEEREQNTT